MQDIVEKTCICNVSQSVKHIGMSKKAIEKIVFFVLHQLNIVGSISINYIGDVRMRTLNRIYRGKDRTTDVLSFAAQEGDMCIPHDDLGDIFISVKQIERQAKEFRVSYKEESARMLVHGILHLLGYDHVKAVEAKKMFGLQEQFLEDIFNGAVYAKKN